MHIASTVDELRDRVQGWRAAGLTVGLVPTMGALHDGHLDLVRHARALADRVVTSIFVNPTQFGPGEDFDRYPRTFDTDCAALASVGCDAVFAPSVAAMYPPGFQTRVEVTRLPQHLCGLGRPGHFAGVTLVVLKLFNACEPDIAVFGEKDYQQVRVIEQMVRDLDCRVRIVRHPTVREADGLARSSRNRYLTADERSRAPVLYATLSDMAARIAAGATDAAALADEGRAVIRAAGLAVEYLSIVDPDTLDDVAAIGGPVRLLVAARLGATRLIDNVGADPATAPRAMEDAT